MEKRSLPLKTQRDTLRNEWNGTAWPVVKRVRAAPLCSQRIRFNTRTVISFGDHFTVIAILSPSQS